CTAGGTSPRRPTTPSGAVARATVRTAAAHPARSPDHARAPIPPPPAAHKPRPPSDHQEVDMNPMRHSHLIRRVTGLLAGLTALLAQVTTGPAALAAQLRP